MRRVVRRLVLAKNIWRKGVAAFMTLVSFHLVLMIIGTGFMSVMFANCLTFFSECSCCSLSFVFVNSAFAANPSGGVALKSLSQEPP